MKSTSAPKNLWCWATICALLCGVFLRWASLGPMATMLHHDEAWHGVDALALLREPRLTPFLPSNFGRESGWAYWLMPYLLGLGTTPFSIRFAATVAGILTLAAVGRLGRELWGIRGGFWSVASLSVLYWHVHLSQLAFRANLYVLLGTLTAACMLRACRTCSWRVWAAAGLLLGLLGYTYFASVGWIACVGALTLGVALLDRQCRRQALLSLLVALIVILPMGVYVIRHPEAALLRPSTVAMADGGLLSNARHWGAAWFQKGDMNRTLNVPGRPILGPLTGALAVLGLVGLVAFSRRWFYGLMVIVWGGVACLPSLVSSPAPHFLRASGMTVAIALTIGAGARLVGELGQQFLRIRGSAVLSSLLLVPVAAVTYRDFHVVWVHHPDTYMAMENHVGQAVDYLGARGPRDSPVYLSPFGAAHPVVQFYSGGLAPRPVAAFQSNQCMVLAGGRANYVSLTLYEPDFERKLAQWAAVTPLLVDSGGHASVPRYSVFAATPDTDQGRHVARFGDALAMKVMQPLAGSVPAGETLPVVLGIRPLRSLDFAPSLFVHLHGVPTPYDGGPLWAQADSQICASYPAHLWRKDETIVQSFNLKTPLDLPPGEYAVAVGSYQFSTGKRLSVSAEGNQEWDYVILHRLTVTER